MPQRPKQLVSREFMTVLVLVNVLSCVWLGPIVLSGSTGERLEVLFSIPFSFFALLLSFALLPLFVIERRRGSAEVTLKLIVVLSVLTTLNGAVLWLALRG